MPAETAGDARIEQFVSDLTALIRSATVDAFEEVLEAQRAAISPTGRKKRVERAAPKRGAPKRAAPKRAASKRANAGDASAPAQLSLPLE